MAQEAPEIKITSGVAVAQMFQGVQTIQDLFRMDAQARNIDTIKANLDLNLIMGIGAASDQALAGPTGNPELLRTRIVEMYGNLLDFWKAGIYQGVGATWADTVDRFVQSANWIYAYKTLQFEIGINQRLRRYWNVIYYPQVPDPALAFRLYMRGKITLAQFKTYASYEGWDSTNAQHLLNAWVQVPDLRMGMELLYKGVITKTTFKAWATAQGWPEEYHEQIIDWMDRVPDNWTAFNMYLRDLIDKDGLNAVYKANLYPEEWHENLTQSFMYVPSIYDLIRMADFIELEEIWALDVLKKRGVSEKDRAKIWDLLQIRPLREEMRGLTTKWQWRYRMGRATLDQVNSAFTEMGLRTKEKALLAEKAELDYQDELVNEWVDILTWRFRTAVITEEEFLQGLLDLGIREEKANLIVELEKAKGYYGYY